MQKFHPQYHEQLKQLPFKTVIMFRNNGKNLSIAVTGMIYVEATLTLSLPKAPCAKLG